MMERFLGIHADYTKYLGYMLYGLAMHNKYNRTLEAGVGQGYISMLLTYAMYQNEKGVHFAVDTDEKLINRLKAKIEVERYGRALRTFVGKSIDYKPTSSLDLIFLDSEHSEENVSQELEHYCPLLRDRGYVLIHDYGVYDGVKIACDRFFDRDQWDRILLLDRQRGEKGCGTLMCQRK